METTKTPCGQEYDEEICPIRHKTQLDLRSQGRRVQFPRCITCPFVTKSAYKESVVIPASQPEKPVKNENLPEKQEKLKPMPKKEKPAKPVLTCNECGNPRGKNPSGLCRPCSARRNAKNARAAKSPISEGAKALLKATDNYCKAKKGVMRANQPAIDAFKAKKESKALTAKQLKALKSTLPTPAEAAAMIASSADTIHAKNSDIESVTLDGIEFSHDAEQKTVEQLANKCGYSINTPSSKAESIYRRALRHFGDHSQIMKTAEEAAELAAAITRYMSPKSWGQTNTLIAMTEELADVEIMCQQMRLIFGNQPIDAAKKMKLERLEKRLADE